MKEPYFETQANFIKAYPKLDRFWIGQNESYTYFTTDGIILHIIPNEYCMIDMNKISPDKRMQDTVIKNFAKYDYRPAQITGYKPNSRWKEVAIIENSDTSVWVQKRYLKDFPQGVMFYITDDKKAVQVRFNGDICGYIMPVRKDV